ncbi:hypothetical protein [Ensifer canadensis]
MRVFYSEDHKLRDAKTELFGGELVPPFVVCMEGGYGVPEIGLNVANVLKGISA